MPVDCSLCKGYVCREGRTDSPTENCPMHGDFPAFDELYNSPELVDNAYRAALVEAEGYCECRPDVHRLEAADARPSAN